jgi:ABC-type phosphate transport system substrate-binding protein
MKKTGFLFSAILILMGVCRLTGQDGASYKVIVHHANPVTSLTREQVSKMFLKKVTQWPRGGAVHPVDLVDNSPVREKFCREIHGKSVAAIKAFWQQRIFSGRDVPPPEKASDAEVISFVLEQPEAIGYVSANAPLGKLKVLQITELLPGR